MDRCPASGLPAQQQQFVSEQRTHLLSHASSLVPDDTSLPVLVASTHSFVFCQLVQKLPDIRLRVGNDHKTGIF